jgi:SAM-dependent methyltransferase
MTIYDTDLAYIHDAGFGEFALRSAPGLLSLLRRNGVDHGLVVDLGCGSGIWARQLGFAGYDVIGVDASPAMIKLARKKAPRAKFVSASLTDFELPKCDAITSIGECLSYAFASDKSGKAMDRFFRRVRRALRPGGVFIFDLAAPGRHPAGMPIKGYWTGNGWAIITEASEEQDVLTRRIRTFRRVGKLYRSMEETHRVRLYRSGPVAAALTRAGFAVRTINRYGQYRLMAGQIGLIAAALPK